MNGTEKICGICDKACLEGVRLLQGFICGDCLKQVSRIKIDDPNYFVIVEKLKKLWQAG